jgi:hypothetical protein
VGLGGRHLSKKKVKSLFLEGKMEGDKTLTVGFSIVVFNAKAKSTKFRGRAESQAGLQISRQVRRVKEYDSGAHFLKNLEDEAHLKQMDGQTLGRGLEVIIE